MTDNNRMFQLRQTEAALTAQVGSLKEQLLQAQIALASTQGRIQELDRMKMEELKSERSGDTPTETGDGGPDVPAVPGAQRPGGPGGREAQRKARRARGRNETA